jgi:hypothetical protein
LKVQSLTFRLKIALTAKDVVLILTVLVGVLSGHKELVGKK